MPLRIAFVGASRFGMRCLTHILTIPQCLLVGVVTAPEVFSISYRPSGVRNVLHADFGSFAREYALPCFSMHGRMSDPTLLAELQLWKPDLLLVAGWYHKVPPAIRRIAPAVGLHASLLPDYSGGAPLVWAIINGESETGITLFQLDDGVDSGPIYGQARTAIEDDDTIATLYARIELLALELLTVCLPQIASRTLVARPQDPARRRVFPQRSPEDGEIDWSWPAERVRNFIRAQTKPYPGAFAIVRGEKITIWNCHRTDRDGKRARRLDGPFAIDPASGNVLVVCGDGRALEVDQLNFRGRDILAQNLEEALLKNP